MIFSIWAGPKGLAICIGETVLCGEKPRADSKMLASWHVDAKRLLALLAAHGSS